jgi:hypothetical protein
MSIDKTVPSSSINITIDGKTYKSVDLTFGSFKRIEKEKSNLSNGDYHNLAKRVDDAGWFNKTVIDAIASYSVLLPGFAEDVNYNDFNNVSMIHLRLLYDSYMNQYLPWFQEWTNFLLNPISKESTVKNDKE